jgi:hypothetical protein
MAMTGRMLIGMVQRVSAMAFLRGEFHSVGKRLKAMTQNT